VKKSVEQHDTNTSTLKRKRDEKIDNNTTEVEQDIQTSQNEGNEIALTSDDINQQDIKKAKYDIKEIDQTEPIEDVKISEELSEPVEDKRDDKIQSSLSEKELEKQRKENEKRQKEMEKKRKQEEKAAAKLKKEEEKRAKEEAKRIKLEEKLKREEEKKAREEAKRIKMEEKEAKRRQKVSRYR
jgi:hypothetical protein